MTKTELKRFGGAVTAADAQNVPKNAAQDLENVRVEDERVKPRFGARKLRDPQSGFAAVWGLHYASGFNSSDANVEEFISFENLSGTVRPITRNVTTGAETTITNSGSGVSLTLMFVKSTARCSTLVPALVPTGGRVSRYRPPY